MTPPHFDGPLDEATRDQRLASQQGRVLEVLRDRQWRTLDAIATLVGGPPASVSAQLRHLRKPRFGSHTIEKRHLGHGLYEYRLAP